jgi:hypothetical protein
MQRGKIQAAVRHFGGWNRKALGKTCFADCDKAVGRFFEEAGKAK